MKTDFPGDLKSELTHALTQNGCTVSNDEDAEDLLLRWYDYESRRIVPTPRTVEESRCFKESRKKLSADELAALDEIIEKLQRGDDVNGHLSKGILNADRPDLLMADWSLYHIHISNTKAQSPNGFFFDRADHLAFAIVNSASVYFLQIFPHKEKNWSNDELLKIVKESWPPLLAPYERKGRLEPNSPISPDQRDEFRKEGINTPTVIGESVVMPPGGGVTAAGTPASVRLKTNGIWNKLAQLQIYLDNYPGIDEELAKEVGCSPDELSVKLIWNGGKPYFREQKSGKELHIDWDIVSKGAAEALRRKKGL